MTRRVWYSLGAAVLVALAALVGWIAYPASTGVQSQAPVVVGFDMDTAGNSCPDDGTDCSLGTIDYCVEVSAGTEDEFDVDVFLEDLPNGESIAGPGYNINFPDTAVNITAQTHNSGTVNLIAQPGSMLFDLSEGVPDTVSHHMVTVADFGAAEYNPPFTHGVLGRYAFKVLPGAAPGVYSLTLSSVVLGRDVPPGGDLCVDYGCAIWDGNWTPQYGLIAIDVPCPPPLTPTATPTPPPVTPTPPPVTPTPTLTPPPVTPTPTPTPPPVTPTPPPTVPPTPTPTPPPTSTPTPTPTPMPGRQLNIDFWFVDWGELLPSREDWVSGDEDMATPDRPTVKNAGDEPLTVGLHFEPMIRIEPWDPTKTIDVFDARFMGEETGPLPASVWYWFANEVPPGAVKQLDLSIHPPDKLPPGIYEGELCIGAEGVEAHCVDTHAVVTSSGSPPNVNYKWELPDMDSFDPNIQYCASTPTDLNGNGICDADDEPLTPGMQMYPNIDDQPEPRKIEFWAAAEDPNGVADISAVWVEVYHPDGSFKYQVDLLPVDCSEIGYYDDNTSPPTLLIEKPLLAAIDTDQMTYAQAEDLITKCYKNEKLVYKGQERIHWDQPPGMYLVEAYAQDWGAALSPPLENIFEVMRTELEADVKITNQLFLSPPSEIVASEDVDLTLRKTLHNNGPYGPVDVGIDTAGTAPADCTAVPDPANQTQANLPVSMDVVVDEVWTIHCATPGEKTFSFDNSIWLAMVHVQDPVLDNNSVSTDLTVKVVPPNQPPDCSAAAPSISEIWPPNHKMVSVNILAVTDPDGDPVSIVITGITQDEPVNGLGDGNTSPDGAGVGTDTAQVRAERAGTRKVPGDGRMYHIHFEASDGKGGVCSGVVNVGVPHDQRPGHVIVDGGELYDSTVP